MILALISIAMIALHLFILLYGGKNRPNADEDQILDQHMKMWKVISFFLLILGTHLVGAVRRILIEFQYWPDSKSVLDWYALPANSTIFTVGVVIFAIGFALRFHAVRHLGRLFTFQVAVMRGHELIDSGAYRWIRHPAYSGSCLILAGSAIANSFTLGILLNIFYCVLLYGYRIPNEEQVLSDHFGERYRSYAQRTYRLFPFLY